ncbi:MAG: hypothetical protein ACYTGN_12650 [Planctomycetota bacterium]|jgi:hypothetical protein
MRALCILLLFAAAAAAQSIDSVRPDCVGPGGKFLLCGDAFGDDPTVYVDGVRARVLRHTDSKILAIVPKDTLPGRADVEVGTATAGLNVVARGAPVVRRLSSHVATPGQILVLVGRHLRGATAIFLDENREEVARANVRGRQRVGFLRVPADLAAGGYTLVLENDAGSSGACSPKVRIAEPGDPTVTSLTPEKQHPGRALTAHGTDLGPLGLCVAHWIGAGGERLFAGGFANGYSKIFTYVPARAEPGATYEVSFELRDGSTTGSVKYTVGIVGGPEILGLSYDEGPAGSPVAILGSGFFRARAVSDRALALADFRPIVEFTRNGASHRARILFGIPGRGDEDDLLVVRVPDVADGAYAVTVRVGGATSNAVDFTVKTMTLTVTAMRPDNQSTTGFVFPVLFEGTGFGSGRDADDILVTWDDDPQDDIAARPGRVLLRNDREMLVVPPGGSGDDRLRAGEYEVRVTRHPGTPREESVVAGPYLVE